MRRFFDPKCYRAVLFDQRGCGRSTPHASVENNTTWDLIADIERIREALGIEEWIVFGGSWGATLALLYAETHPERVTHLVLRGVFTMTRAELDWFYGGGASAFWPDEWRAFSGMVPADERNDLISAYHKRLFSGDMQEETRFARAWAGWESALASLDRGMTRVEGPALTHALLPGSKTITSLMRDFWRKTVRSCETCIRSRVFPV
jgi:proline iminopeptidase